jgi:hypothetical protein
MITNNKTVFILCAGRSVIRDWKIQGSNPSGEKINTTCPRSQVFLRLHNVRILPGRAKYSAVTVYAREDFLNSPHAVKLFFL